VPETESKVEPGLELEEAREKKSPLEDLVIKVDRASILDISKIYSDRFRLLVDDPKILKVSSIKVSEMSLWSPLVHGERETSVPKMMMRLERSGKIPLDAKFFLALAEQRDSIPCYFKNETESRRTEILIAGSIFGPRDVKDNRRFLIHFFWKVDHWSFGSTPFSSAIGIENRVLVINSR